MNTTLLLLIGFGVFLGLGRVLLNRKRTSPTGDSPSIQTLGHPDTDHASDDSSSKAITKAFSTARVPLERYIPIPDKFTGRRSEYSKIKRNRQDGIQMIGIYGIPGIGKTAMACHVGVSELALFKDGQFYLDLKANRSKSLSTLEVMACVIQFLNPGEKLSSDKTEISQRYRAVLKNKRIVLIFDNLDSPGKAKNLLPPKSCLLIATSDKNLSVPGMYSIQLDVMELDDARDLFQTVAPRAGFWAKEIAKLCGGVPLALTLAARFIAHHTQMDPSVYTQEFHGERTRMSQRSDSGVQETVKIAFNITTKNISDAARNTLSKLLIFPDSFTKTAEMFICEDNNSEQLGTLVIMGLVQHNDLTDRYSIHREIRRFAEGLADSAARASALRRHATYYLNIIVSANQSFIRGGEKAAEGLSEFDREWENIRIGFDWARTHCSQDKDATRLCSAYTEAGAAMLSLRQPVNEYIRWLETALKAATLMADPETEKNHLTNLGRIYTRIKEYAPAIEYLEKARTLAKELDDKACEQEAILALGKACLITKNAEKAIPCFQRDLIIIRASNDRARELEVLQNLGWAYHHEKQLKEATKFYNEGLELARKKNDKIRQGAILAKLGQLLTEQDDAYTAVKFLEQGLALIKATQDKDALTDCLKLLGDAQMKIGDHRKASLYYKQGLAAAQNSGSSRDEGVLCKNLGDAFYALNEHQVAISHYQNAIPILRKIGFEELEGESLWNLSQLIGKAGNKEQAIEHAQTALRIFEGLNHPETEKAGKQLALWKKETAGSG